MKRRPPERCVCGASYHAMRTGLTFGKVRAMLHDVPDPNREGWWRQKGRRSVLGFWHELKMQQWESMHGSCERDAIIRARLARIPAMTPAQLARQRESFARGNVAIDERRASLTPCVVVRQRG